MSVVTNAILSFSIIDEDRISEDIINIFFEGSKGFVSVDSDTVPRSWYGGTKNLETPLFIGAFNYFDTEEFCRYLKTLPFRDPDSVQLIVKEQDDEIFKIKTINDFNL